MPMAPTTGSSQTCAITGQSAVWQLWDSVLNVYVSANAWKSQTGQTPKQSVIEATGFSAIGGGYAETAPGQPALAAQLLHSSILVNPSL